MRRGGTTWAGAIAFALALAVPGVSAVACVTAAPVGATLRKGEQTPPTAGAPLVSYSRAGGFPPRDAERLTITTMGAFDLQRTVGTTRIGWFTGTLSAPKLASLRRALGQVRGSYRSPGAAAPEAVTERVTVGAYTVETTEGAGIPPSWELVLGRIRPLVTDLTASPRAGVELVLATGRVSGQLRQIGTDPIEIRGPTLRVDVFVVDSRGRTGAQWTATDPLEPVRAGGGWSRDLDLARSGARPRRTDTYEVTVEFAVVGGDGVVRTARLSRSSR